MKPILGPLEIRRRLIREELGTRERMCDKWREVLTTIGTRLRETLFLKRVSA